MAHLTVLNGPNHSRMVGLNKGYTYRLGRDPSLDLCVDDGKASRVHLEIKAEGEDFHITDLRSKNGTTVNGEPITTAILREGDEIQIGETRISFSLQDPAKNPPRSGHDSILAARLPVGAVPTLGGGAHGAQSTSDGFETLEMSQPLPLLRLEGSESGHTALQPPTVSMQRETPATLERANRCLRALYSVARDCADCSTSKDLLNALVSKMGPALEADRFTPILIDENGRWHVAERETGDSGRESSGIRKAVFSKVPVSRTIVDYALRTKRAVLTTPRNDQRFSGAQSIGEQGITSAMCVPILHGDKTLGLMYADRLGGTDFDREDHELLTASCLQAGPALAGLQRLEQALAHKERLLSELKSQYNLIGSCPPMKDVFGFIERAAPTDAAVMVLGESGTGKELIARAIHYNSNRRDGPLVIVNCAALSESLIESELFGHAKGAFTGATTDRKGRFEMAHEGTIFLDEIGELSMPCQTKLLRVLENGEISRVGEGRVRKVDVRLVAATNRELGNEVQGGRFREDLFYRLNVLTVNLPPLRDRGDDIRVLAEHFLQAGAEQNARARLKFSDEALHCLQVYKWPGNVRELRNLTERLSVLCAQDIVNVKELPNEFQGIQALPSTEAGGDDPVSPVPDPSAGPSADQPLADVERDHILRVLKAHGGNKKQTAEILGIDRSTLYAKLRAYGILPS